MKIAIIFFKYFPYGGLQRDALQIAKALHVRGHQIEVYTMQWQGEVPDFLRVNIVQAKGWVNYKRYARFSQQVLEIIQGKEYDAVIGFNKMPGLDFYYAADPCFATAAAEKYPRLFSYLPRYRYFYKAEEAVFSHQVNTQIFLIAPQEQPKFEKMYHTPAQRFHYLPPGVKRDRIRPENAEDIRQAMRQQLGLAPDTLLVLMIGSGFKTKGLDRALLAIAALPEALRQKTRFMVMGQDNPRIFLRLTQKLGLSENVTIFKGRDDVPAFLLAADMLIHPAYRENAGVVLLEALCAGLPVLTTAVCGYAHYIDKAKAGHVLPVKFVQEDLNRQLQVMLEDNNARAQWQQNGIAYSLSHDLYSLAMQAAMIVEKIVREHHGNR